MVCVSGCVYSYHSLKVGFVSVLSHNLFLVTHIYSSSCAWLSREMKYSTGKYVVSAQELLLLQLLTYFYWLSVKWKIGFGGWDGEDGETF